MTSITKQGKQLNKKRFRTNIILPTDNVQRSNIVKIDLVNTEEKLKNVEQSVVELQKLLKKYPWAKGWSLEKLQQFERNAVPISVDGVVRAPSTYKPKVAAISKDTRTEEQRQQGQKIAKQKLEQSRQLKETKQASEVINHPYNPIGWIPGVRTMFNVGADQQYSKFTGQTYTPYTADAGISTGVDALTLGFGLGPLKNYAGSYAGTVAGGLVGEKFDSPRLGQFIGGIAGGLTFPSVKYLYNTGKKAYNAFEKGFIAAYLRNHPELFKNIDISTLNNSYLPYVEHLNLPFNDRLSLPYYVQDIQPRLGSINNLPSSEKVITNYDSPKNREAFRLKFNKWNRRYGYPMISKDLVADGAAFDKAIQDRLNQHNTFLRGVFIDDISNPQKYNELINQMTLQGIEPTQDNILEFLATHYLPETGYGGRSGFRNIPYVRKNGYDDELIGTIYTSNSLDQAVGYANRSGTHTYRGVFKVKRPISFEGSREDWVLNGDFPLFNTGHSTDRSNIYYKYELPYLMSTGKAVPKTLKINWNKYNDLIRYKSSKESLDRYNTILNIYKGLGRTPKLKYFGIGTPFLDDRVYALSKYLDAISYDKKLQDRVINFNNAFTLSPYPGYKPNPWDQTEYLDPDEYTQRFAQIVYPPEVIDQFEKIVNSKGYIDKQRNKTKLQQEDLQKATKKEVIQEAVQSSVTPETIKQTVLDAGITPNNDVLNIGTSERLKTSTINSDPRKAFQHVIFTGQPWEQGLEIVERVPYSQWRNINGSTAHMGDWTPGVSRKSKKNGGKLLKET